MAIRVDIKRASIFNEFTSEEQEFFFGCTAHKTLHHIDTLYYSIKIREDRVIEGEFESPEIIRFIRDLEDAKQTKQQDYEREVSFHDLSVELKSFSLYAYCLSENEMYDIFVAKTVPTYETPRIVVQLRTQALILKGVEPAIRESFNRVRSILSFYGIEVEELNENRIDYAWHTNCIQNVNHFMDDKFLRKHLKSQARNGFKHFNPQNFEYNYLQFVMISMKLLNCFFLLLQTLSKEF